MASKEPNVSLAIARRVRRGWSQWDLAAASGVPAGTIGPAESGHIQLSADAKRRIAEALNLTAQEIRRIRELAP